MAAEPSTARRFEFTYPSLATQLLVEAHDDEVVIRATKDTFTELQKQSFIRHLALEGFVSESLRWTYTGRGFSGVRLRWLIDPTWTTHAPTDRPRRWVARVVLSASIIWFGLMTVVLLKLH